jgi:hypothetical protein
MGAAADVLGRKSTWAMRYCSLRIELPIVGAEHQQGIALAHSVVAGREADESGHADVVRIVPFDVLFAAVCVHHRCLEALAEQQQRVVRTLASRAAQDGDAFIVVE